MSDHIGEYQHLPDDEAMPPSEVALIALVRASVAPWWSFRRRNWLRIAMHLANLSRNLGSDESAGQAALSTPTAKLCDPCQWKGMSTPAVGGQVESHGGSFSVCDWHRHSPWASESDAAYEQARTERDEAVRLLRHEATRWRTGWPGRGGDV
jgi:hypothetical protein